MSVDPTCEHCGEEYDQNSEHRCEPNHQQVRALEGVVDALVDYVESVEWTGPMVTVCRMDGSERRATRCASCASIMPDGYHQDDCKWMALMHAAGRR